MKNHSRVFLVPSLPHSQLHPFIHQVVIFYDSQNAFQQPSDVLKLLRTLVRPSLQWWISFGCEGPTRNLMFTINVNDYFVLPDFHWGCTRSISISDVKFSMFGHLWEYKKRSHLQHVGPYRRDIVWHHQSIRPPLIAILSILLRLIQRFLYHSPYTSHCPFMLQLQLCGYWCMHKAHLWVKYTMHGLSKRIFLHYYGDLNCLRREFFCLKMMQLGMDDMIGV